MCVDVSPRAGGNSKLMPLVGTDKYEGNKGGIVWARNWRESCELKAGFDTGNWLMKDFDDCEEYCSG